MTTSRSEPTDCAALPARLTGGPHDLNGYARLGADCEFQVRGPERCRHESENCREAVGLDVEEFDELPWRVEIPSSVLKRVRQRDRAHRVAVLVSGFEREGERDAQLYNGAASVDARTVTLDQKLHRSSGQNLQRLPPL